jgi:hypothetical protein
MEENSIISLKEVNDGRLQVEIHSSGGCVSMDLNSKSCDPLAEFGETLLEIRNYCRCRNDNEPRSFYLFWGCGSSQYSLEFIPHDENSVDLLVGCCSDVFAGIQTETELKLRIRATLDELIKNFYEEMKSTLLNYGFIGYRRRWLRHDFPIATFLKLYSMIYGHCLSPSSLPRCLKCLQEIAAENPEFIFNDE